MDRFRRNRIPGMRSQARPEPLARTFPTSSRNPCPYRDLRTGFFLCIGLQSDSPMKNGLIKRKRFSEEETIAVLREYELGMKADDLARKHGISEATRYK